MKKVVILCHRCFNEKTKKIDVGGVETYAANLCALFKEEGWFVTLLQHASTDCILFSEENFEIYGFSSEKYMKKAYNTIFSEKNDLTIFLLFEYGTWINSNKKTIIVQHGIEFDGFTSTKSNILLSYLQKLYLQITHRVYLKELKYKLSNADAIVCVDLNFINYVRATFRFRRYEEKLFYVPNFSSLINTEKYLQKLEKKNKDIRIIIPRRFEYHRGVKLYAVVCKKLLRKYQNIEFAFIGEGNYSEFLKQEFHNESRVKIYKVSHEEILDEYYKADICVIPTLYSEGTSLSAIEAMCCGCSLIVSNVGGLGNLVLPDYNGIICEPTIEAFYEATCKMIEDDDFRNQCRRNAYEIAQKSFSLDVWKNRWLNIVSRLDV